MNVFRLFLSASALIFAIAAPAAAKDKSTDKIKVSENVVYVKLSTKGNDIAFDQTAIQVPFSSKVTIVFNNEAAPKSEILHNVAVLKPGTLDAVLKDLQESGYDIEKMRKNPSVLAITQSLAPGAEGRLEFSPSEPGFYPYVCLMPGHADMLGMKGVLNVEKPKVK